MPRSDAAKAYVSGAIAFLTALTTAWTVGNEFQLYYLVASLAPGLAAFMAVYWTTNEEA